MRRSPTLPNRPIKLTKPLKATKPLSLSTILVVPFVVQICVIVGITSYLSWLSGQRAIEDVAVHFRQTLTDNVHLRLNELLQGAIQRNASVINVIDQGLVNSQDLSTMARLMRQQVEQHRVNHMKYGLVSGKYVLAGFLQDQKYITVVQESNLSSHASSPQLESKLESKPEVKPEPNLINRLRRIDLRQEEWFTKTLRVESQNWSITDASENSQIPQNSISTNARIYDNAGQLVGVLSSDILLSDISQSLNQLRGQTKGQVFIIDRTGDLVARLSSEQTSSEQTSSEQTSSEQTSSEQTSSEQTNNAGKTTNNKNFSLQPSDRINLDTSLSGVSTADNSLMSQSIDFIKHDFQSLQNIRQAEQVQFSINGQQQFVQVTPYRVGPGLDWLIVVVLPESDFTQQISDNLTRTFLVSLLALICVAGFGLLNSRRIAQPILHLSQASKGIANGNFQQTIASQNIRELDVLAQSFNQMSLDIARSQQQLEGYSRLLEDNIQERTESLKLSETRFRAIFETAGIGISVTDLNGCPIQVNPAASRILGHSIEDLKQIDFRDLTHPVDLKLDLALYAELIDGKRDCYQIEKRYFHKAGHIVWTTLTLTAIRDEAGAVIFTVAMIQDITARKIAEQELYNANAEMRALFAAIDQLIIVFDRTGKHLRILSRNADIMYQPDRDRIGRTLHDVFAANIADRFLRYIHIALDAQTTIRTEYSLVLNGRETWSEASISPIDDETVVWVAYDITDRKQAEQDLKIAKDAAEEASCAKSNFLANMSHELRTPLNAILGFTQLVAQDQRIPAEQRSHLSVVEQNGEQLLRQINDVLDMSKIEAGKITLNLTICDLHCLLQNLETLFHPQAQSKNLDFSIEYLPTVPRYIQTDELKLRQVLTNLIGNSLKFTKQGSIHLKVENISSLAQAERSLNESAQCRLKFVVIDTGVGIAPEQVEAIFQPFTQVGEHKFPGQGTGLGLSISHKFVQLLGGDLSVNSMLDQGTTFQFQITTVAVHPTTTAPTFSLDRTENRTEDSLSKLTDLSQLTEQFNYRLLVVDDTPTNRHLVVKLLELVGCNVREAANGQEAIALWQTWQPHIILMDMRMPVMDGYETTRRIKAIAASPAPIIIAVTASAFEEERTAILAAGCDDFIRKPFQKDFLYSKIAKHLQLIDCVPSAPSAIPEHFSGNASTL